MLSIDRTVDSPESRSSFYAPRAQLIINPQDADRDRIFALLDDSGLNYVVTADNNATTPRLRSARGSILFGLDEIDSYLNLLHSMVNPT